MERKRKRICAIFFTLYCILMLWLLFHRPGYAESDPYWQQIGTNLNLIPFRTLRLFAQLLDDHRPQLVRAAVINLFGNIIMFIPLGYFLPALWKKLRKLYRVLLVTALSITLVEIVQLFTLVGSCDIDDLILNLMGAAIGYGLYRFFAKA